MEKHRIIIADTDISYIVPLQLKFAEELFEAADIEIIHSREYFRELFSTPQRADILILSEDLYSLLLHRHNIGHIFLMTGRDDERSDDHQVTRINKYTSSQEVFHEITGKSGITFEKGSNAKKGPQVILVYSACGGVGKTTVSLGISMCLAKKYKNVLYINADRLHTFQSILENPDPIMSSDIYTKLAIGGETVYNAVKSVVRKEGFSYLPPFKAALMSLGISYEVYRGLVQSAKASGDYDYIIVDADTVFDEEKAAMLSIADRVVIITTQTTEAVAATDILVSNINGVGSEKYLFICNRFSKDRENAFFAPNMTHRFRVQEYIEEFERADRRSVEMLSHSTGIQKTAFLVM